MAQKKPLTIKQLTAAIRLCQRPEGATMQELRKVLGRSAFDGPEVLRAYLYRYLPGLKLVAMSLPREIKRNLYATRIVYRIHQELN
jgi:MarR-like DNA-binding transcriptional regulator SgrR of sgrS sRNA